MKRLAIAAVALALVAGVIIGGIVGNPFDGTASAAPPRQVREDEITIYVGYEGLGFPSYQLAGPWRVIVDGSHYPEGTLFYLEAGISVLETTACVRLVHMPDETPIAESEVCISSPDPEYRYLIERSGPFELPSGQHVYALQEKVTGGSNVYLTSTRLIAVWTEGPGWGKK